MRLHTLALLTLTLGIASCASESKRATQISTLIRLVKECANGSQRTCYDIPSARASLGSLLTPRQKMTERPPVLINDETPRCAFTAEGVFCNAAGRRVNAQHGESAGFLAVPDGNATRLAIEHVGQKPVLMDDKTPRCAYTASGIFCNAAGRRVSAKYNGEPSALPAPQSEADDPDNGAQ
jgi:hypothetical protein